LACKLEEHSRGGKKKERICTIGIKGVRVLVHCVQEADQAKKKKKKEGKGLSLGKLQKGGLGAMQLIVHVDSWKKKKERRGGQWLI